MPSLSFPPSSALLTLLIVVACSGGWVVNAVSCPAGQAQFGNLCYKTYRPSPRCGQDFSFSSAQAFCQANGGQLASIHSQAQEDFLTALVKKDQSSHSKQCGCHKGTEKKDFFYWIGLQLDHAGNGSVNGSSWTDGSPVNYGNPLGAAAFRPPFVTGRPTGSANDGSDDSEVCPLGDRVKCVKVYGFGPTVGQWTDDRCSNNHTQTVTCGGCSGESAAVSNSSSLLPKKRVSYDSQEEPQVDECRDEAALNGFICEYCPAGWTAFGSHCYKPVMVAQTTTQYDAACAALGANVVSIHSNAENAFVAQLANAAAAAPPVSLYIGLRLVHPNNVFNAPVTSASWTDSSPADYGNPSVAPWSTFGTYPWAPGGASAGFPPQPDNRPPPGTCVLMWLSGFPGEPFGTWDDANCPQLSAAGTVCEI